jgi:hypothetical protein
LLVLIISLLLSRRYDLANLAYAIAKVGLYGQEKDVNINSRQMVKLQKKLETAAYQHALYQVGRWSLARLGVAPADIPLEARSKEDGPDR